ncbi:MAG: DUF2520 domain-containing protein, partial [Rickettsia endosymbiont of Ixodes persulcatus]|nr:DUF2520 domain-containing protein [Rickettsia endosymbiont of Ixodes persulcatus]
MNGHMIGAGRLGKNIARALTVSKLMALEFICNRSLKSAQQACNAIDAGTAVDSILKLPPTDVTWIASNDDAIESIIKTLAQNTHIKPGSFVIHCSGVLNSRLLSPLKERGCFIASFHPLKAFIADVEDNAFKGVDCVLEGDDEVCNWLKLTFNQIGANIITIQPEAKALYHCAATLASNYLITLAACSEELMRQAGIPAAHIRPMIGNLMQSNLNNLQRSEHMVDALTGPLMRGDLNTIQTHLKSLSNP